LVVPYFDRSDENPFHKALEDVRRKATREGYCFQHVQALIVAIDQYAEAATGNRQYFQNPPHSIGGSRKAGDVHALWAGTADTKHWWDE
jgi:hypothetical protein